MPTGTHTLELRALGAEKGYAVKNSRPFSAVVLTASLVQWRYRRCDHHDDQLFRAVVLIASLVGCAETNDADSASAEQDAQLRSTYRALSSGSRTTLVDGITAAENLLFTSDDRLLATGNDGVFEVRRDAAGEATAELLVTASPCNFLGITEANGFVYVNCSDFATSAIYAARLSASLDFRLILSLPDVMLANGLAHDDAGHLFVAQTMQNQILRVTLAPNDPFQVVSTEAWLAGSGLFTNGLKVLDGTIYWSDFGGINRAKILSSGRAGRVHAFASALTFFDDLFVDGDGMLIADYLGNAVRAYTSRGRLIAQTPAVFGSPSSVLPARGRLGLGPNDLVVSEKTANQIAVFSPDP